VYLLGWYEVGKLIYSIWRFCLRVCCGVLVEFLVCGIVLFVDYLLSF
jgi:hypothetical protein